MQRRKSDLEGMQHREAELDYRKANIETRTVPATLSSETPVKRWFGNEVLRHTKDSVDLSRAADGLPLLFNHDSNVFIGAVRNVRVEEGKVKGDMQFSENARASEIFADVTAGLLRNVSIGYRIDEYDETRDGDVEVTKFSIHEASVVPIPADQSVGINRKESTTMDTTRKSDEALEAREAEASRIAGIRDVFNQRWTEPRHIDLMGKLVKDGATVEEAQRELLDMIGINAEPAGKASPDAEQNRSGPTADTLMTESLAVRFGVETDKDIVARCKGSNEFGGMTIIEMARRWFEINGESGRGSARSIADRILNYRAVQDTTDFANILADVAEKSLLKAYWDAPETWRAWASTSSLQDFKTANRVNLSEFDTLPIINEGGTYTEGAFTDSGEPITLATYGMNWSITREALINDDVSAFTRASTAMGLAAARTVGDLAYGVLTSNPAMSDTNPLFDAVNHGGNDVPVGVGGGPPDADTVQAGKVVMALQKGPKGEATLGIQPAHLIVPIELEGTANTLMAAQYNPASTAGTLEPNVVQGIMNVVSEHRLSADSALVWYMFASSMGWDTVDLAFLNGNQTPYQERRQQDIANDNITYKVRIDAAAAPMDWRGVYRNAGAAA